MFISDASASSFDHVPEPRPLILIIGGERWQRQVLRLAQAFPDHRVVHIPTRRSDASSRAFVHSFRDPRIAFVIVVAGLCRTQHSKDAARMSRANRVPWAACRRVPNPMLLREILRRRGGQS